MARRRKNLSEKKVMEEKESTINKLLKKQTSKVGLPQTPSYTDIDKLLSGGEPMLSQKPLRPLWLPKVPKTNRQEKKRLKSQTRYTQDG